MDSNAFQLPNIPEDPKWISWWEEHMNMTRTWENFPRIVQRLIISCGAIVIATLLLFVGKLVFPGYDFSQQEAMIVTALSSLIALVIKDLITE